MTTLKSKQTFIVTIALAFLFYAPSLAQERSNNQTENTIEFSQIDEAPIYPGCETITSIDGRKNCMRSKVSKFVNRSFNTSVADSLEAGTHRIVVNFRIDKNGDAIDINASALYPELKEEAKRVIKLLSKMEPGKENGEAVDVLYQLPISFRLAD